MKTEEHTKIINGFVKIWRDPIRNHEDWNKYKHHLVPPIRETQVYIVNHNDRGEHLIQAWVDYFVSLIDTESKKVLKTQSTKFKNKNLRYSIMSLRTTLQKDTNLNVHIHDTRNPNLSHQFHVMYWVPTF